MYKLFTVFQFDLKQEFKKTRSVNFKIRISFPEFPFFLYIPLNKYTPLKLILKLNLITYPSDTFSQNEKI